MISGNPSSSNPFLSGIGRESSNNSDSITFTLSQGNATLIYFSRLFPALLPGRYHETGGYRINSIHTMNKDFTIETP